MFIEGRRHCVCFFIFGTNGWRCFSISNITHQINEEIRDKEVRLIGDDGAQLGIVSSHDALAAAQAKELDLVKIAPKAQPPVCRIMDYGKFRFEQTKKDKEARRNQHVVEIKEIRMSPGIDTHDFDVKQRSAHKFLSEGNKVKVSVRFKGRSIAHASLGEQLLIRFSDGLNDIANLEKAPKLEGRNMALFLAPKNAKPEVK
jgi:translation initiation factor IF-3